MSKKKKIGVGIGIGVVAIIGVLSALFVTAKKWNEELNFEDYQS